MSETDVSIPTDDRRGPLRGGAVSAVISWVVILGTVAFVAGSYFAGGGRAAAGGAGATRGSSLPLYLAGRYVIGARALFGGGAGDAAAASYAAAIQSLEKQATAPIDRLRLVMIVGELLGKEAALSRLDGLEPTLNDPELREDARLLRQAYDSGTASLTPEQRERLAARHEWLGELALSFGSPDIDPARHKVLHAAKVACLVDLAGVVLFGTYMLAGLVLAAVALVRRVDGKLSLAFRPATGPTTPFLEAFAIYIGGFVGLPLAMRAIFPQARVILLLAGVAPVVLAIVWPLLRGVDRRAWRQGLGWHAGRGWVREIAAGLVGYMAGAPVLGLGILATLVLSSVSRRPATHPIVNYLGGDGWQIVLLYLLAAVWAPVTEETLFRGALFHHLRGRWRWLLSAAVVSLLFAAVHPQGWVGLPALFAIAVVLAAVREWRGTILASAAAHAMNNGVILTFTLLALRAS